MSIAEEPSLTLRGRPVAWGGSSHTNMPHVLSGSLFFLKITNTTDQSRDSLLQGWPEGYIVEAALDLPEGSPFNSTLNLIEHLQPEPFYSYISKVEQKKMLQGDSAEIDLKRLNTKEFVLHIPSDLIGHTLTFRVQYNRYGTNQQSNCTDPITIIAPVTRCDTARVIAGEMYLAWKKMNKENMERVIWIADSMLANNLSDAVVWAYAISAAVDLVMPEKELTYLDRLYQDFGVAYVVFGESIPPPILYQGPPKPYQQETYMRKRNQLLMRILEQQIK